MLATRIEAKNVAKGGIVGSTYPMASRRKSAAAVHTITSARAPADRGCIAWIGNPGKILLPGLGTLATLSAHISGPHPHTKASKVIQPLLYVV
jgi:hypothetical protein